MILCSTKQYPQELLHHDLINKEEAAEGAAEGLVADVAGLGGAVPAEGFESDGIVSDDFIVDAVQFYKVRSVV